MDSVPKPDHLPGQDPPSDAEIDAAVRLLSLLGDETRLRLVWALSIGEFDVTTLVAMTGSTKTATSQHLAKLRDAGLVKVRRDGRRAIYKMKTGHLRKLIRETLVQAQRQVGNTDRS